MTSILQIVIREMTLDDYDEVVTVWVQAGLPYRPEGRDSRESIARELKRPTAIFLVAVIDDRIVGAVLCTQDGRKGWLNRLAVLPDLRRQGIARLLVEESERRFHDLGIKLFSCLIQKDNQTSQVMFAELGYKLNDDVLYYSKKTDQSY